MKRVLILLVILVAYALGQSYGSLSFGPISPTLVLCPAGSAGMTILCTTGTGPYTIWVSYNGGAYQLLVPAQTVAAGVTSLNGKTGALTVTSGVN